MTTTYQYKKDLTELTNVLKVMLWILLGVNVIAIISNFMQMDLLSSDYSQAEADLNDSRQSIVNSIYIIVSIISSITFLTWIYRANLNCHHFGAEGMRFTPGWSIGWYFIPIPNLWKPYQAMKEIWGVSKNPSDWQDESDSTLLGWWWAFWLVSVTSGLPMLNASVNLDSVSSLESFTTLLIVYNIIDIISCLIVLSIVATIASNQEKLVSDFSTPNWKNDFDQKRIQERVTGIPKVKSGKSTPAKIARTWALWTLGLTAISQIPLITSESGAEFLAYTVVGGGFWAIIIFFVVWTILSFKKFITRLITPAKKNDTENKPTHREISITEHLNALPVGHQLNEYRIEGVIGSGGFGITYKALDTQLDKVVAIKEYLPNEFAVRTDATTVQPKSTADQDDYQWGLTRFLDEARTLARFEHPHLNHVHRYFEDNNTAYLVLDYIEGETLSDLLKREGRLESTRLQRLVTELLSGLDEVHHAGYVHRDIKPSNIMVRANGSSVLLDFGAARQVLGQRSKNITSILTRGYAPIEQYDQKGDDIGPWTDLYALGMVAYRCVSGISEAELIDAITRARLADKGKQDQDMKPAVEIGKGHYPLSLLKAIDWAIKVEEEDRPQSVVKMQETIAGGETSGAAPDASRANQVEHELGEETERIIEAAYQGDAFGQNALGNMYRTGKGVAHDDTEAVKWFHKAAAQGNTSAQHYLGNMYRTGKGVAQDDTEAAKWYRKSAEQGEAFGQNALGAMYRNGHGVTQSDAEAVKWYRKAAEQGNAWSQSNLGLMYSKGRGVAQNDVEAVKWYRKSAEQGEAFGQNALGEMYENGQGVAQNHAEAAKWYRKSAEQGNAWGQYNLGTMHLNGYGVAQNDAEAVEWFRKAAEQGNPLGQYYLGYMYLTGEGVAQDDAEAVKWFRKSAEQGDADAQHYLGYMYQTGEGVAHDDAEAVKWFRKSAEQGDADAQHYLGYMYQNGEGVAQDDAEAVKWFRKSAEQGDADAQHYLGYMYQNGLGVPHDDAEAAKWYRKAVKQGHAGAKEELEDL